MEHAWHRMQRIRPSWTVIALSGFAHERDKNPRWRRPGVKNIEHLRAYFLRSDYLTGSRSRLKMY